MPAAAPRGARREASAASELPARGHCCRSRQGTRVARVGVRGRKDNVAVDGNRVTDIGELPLGVQR